MSRLADYFVIIGYDGEKERSGQAGGRVIQRFPERDWDNCPFTIGLEHFCQPVGWQLTTQKQKPTFFISVLTDIDAERHYCASLTFTEDVALPPRKVVDDEEEVEEEEMDPAMVRSSKLYAPKSLAVVSRLDCFETFRNCLGLIYTVYIENMNVELETLIGNILGCITVPPPGGPQVRFSIGASDRQALQPPLCPTLPTTNTSVAILLQQLGIRNALSVFCAAQTDHKILFHSSSYTRLTDASHAITALMYPLKYSYVYIPLLPVALLEVLHTPTPFIAGVNTAIKPDSPDLLDVIVVDLDGGSIEVPDNINIPIIPDPIYTRTVHSLNLLLHPELLNADLAFPPLPDKPPVLEMLDKEIRAVFLRLFAELFFAYRSCLTITRIHPKPFITFLKANFLGQRGLLEDDFSLRVLDSMSFNTFVADRGPPYRVCDIFDEVFASMQDMLKIEETNPERLLHNIRDLAQQLYLNENPNPQPYTQKVPKPTHGAHSRIHQLPFPIINKQKVQDIIEEGIAKQNIKTKLTQIRPQQLRIVPSGPHISSAIDHYQTVSTNARRLEVLRNCVNFIFENRITDARKIFAAVLRALKSKIARQALVCELSHHVSSNRAQLEHQQFDMVVRLLNCSLLNESANDENSIAAAILPLATSFCRKLSTGIIQFAYTCVQEHAVWANQQFWEAAFYQDVQKQIRQLYIQDQEDHQVSTDFISNYVAGEGIPQERWRDSWRSHTGNTPDAKRRSVTHNAPMFQPREISALEIAAEQMRLWYSLKSTQQQEMISNEESTVYSQAIHYANRMVYMRVPLDIAKRLKEPYGLERESSSSNITNSVAESDSFDAESGFDEAEVSDKGAGVIRFVTRFVDKVCTESGVTADHMKSLHQMVPGVVAMHTETLEAVHKEIKRLPPIQKPKILTPVLLPGEEIVMEGLRVYLIPDGREEATGGNMGGPSLIPAEGALFLTTYRIVFKGTPCDPLVCEQVISRSFPVSTLTREKKISVQYLAHIDQWLQEGLQLRSNTFQLMKVAFDEEVNTEDIETLRKLSHKVRNPTSIVNTFAFTGYMIHQPSQLGKAKEKNASLKGFAKKTLMKTARKAGLKSKEPPRKQKYILPTPPLSRRTLGSQLGGSLDYRDQTSHFATYDEELSVIDEQEIFNAIQSDAKNVDRLAERAYCQDYSRLGLGSLVGNHPRTRAEPFRLTMVNTNYSVSRSYPAVLVVPQSITDDSIRKFARSHRQYRFPVVTWRHPQTRAVLLRASGFHGKSVMGMLKGHHNNPTGTRLPDEPQALEQRRFFSALVASTLVGTSTGETSTSVEQEKYFGALVLSTPMGNHRGGSAACVSDSLTSLDSLVMSVGGMDHILGETPDTSRRNPLARAVSSLRSSGGKAKCKPLPSPEPEVLKDEKSNTFPQTNKSATLPARMSPRIMAKRAFSAFRFGHSPQLPDKSQPVNSPQLQDKSPSHSINSRSMSRVTSMRERSRLSTGSLQYHHVSPKQNGTIDMGELATDTLPQSFHKAVLYVLGEKNQLKGIKMESFPKCDFIPVDYTDVRHIKSSFKKLMRACVPSAPYTDPEKGYLKAVEDSEWQPQLQNILQTAGAVVDLMDVQGSSVIICLEDGVDFTTQVVSVAQVLMDPYYRTLEGFRVLIEKEWLSFGHRFSHRSNQTVASQTSGFAPVFLQFLDVVHQIHQQFPLSFEFNQYLLKFMAYHYVSNRFRTFMLDNEFERMEAGWLMEESHNREDMSQDVESNMTSRRASASAMSIWDYIEKERQRSPKFHNFVYSPLDQETVLRPYSNTSNLMLWDYYLTEDLAHGPSYDFEIAETETSYQEEQEMVDGPMTPSSRKIINGCYDNIGNLEPDACSFLTQEVIRLQAELKRPCRSWRALWERLEQPNRDTLKRQASINTQIVRSHGRSTHKRSTIELLVKGKMLGEAARMYSQPHRFEKFTYSTPAYCDYCSHVLWGLVKTGMQCADCGYNCHERCLTNVPKTCTKLRPVSEASISSTNISKSNVVETQSMSGVSLLDDIPDVGTLRGSSQIYHEFSSTPTEHRTHEGYLFKRGALLKGWKQRWFVLDSMKHQLRYYDSADDQNCKGYIDLAEVQMATPLRNVQGAPKKADDNAFFEIRTIRRNYNFLAPDATSAQEWIDKIGICIQ